MFNKESAKAELLKLHWVEGAILPIVEGPYRYRIVLQCSDRGREKAHFANGEHSYFSYVEIVSGDGEWLRMGADIVPVLPDGRLIMVVEQRPPQGRFPDRPMIAVINGKRIDLRTFGPYGSLEFPGGGVDLGEKLNASFLRELVEETGVEDQTALFYRRRAFCPFGADLALQKYLGVVFLSGHSYEEHVATDGGLNVVALTTDEVQQNIWSGVIHSGQAALLQWAFYQEIEALRRDPALEKKLVRSGYVRIEKVKIVR